jgi:hypothetical protein
MHSPTGRKSGLPRSFPVGAVYVVEGRGGQYGHLRVSARYFILPDGQRVEVLSPLGRLNRLRPRRRHAKTLRQPQPRHRASGRVRAAKKFAVGGGTTGEE